MLIIYFYLIAVIQNKSQKPSFKKRWVLIKNFLDDKIIIGKQFEGGLL